MTALPPLVSDLAVWIGTPIDEDDARAAAVLSAASAYVAEYASKTTEWAQDAPDAISALVVQVAARIYLSPPNPNVKSWTKGPFGESYFDAAAVGLYLTDEEKSVLNRYRPTTSGIGTISTTRGECGPYDARQFVPVEGGAEPILYLSADDAGL